MGRRVQGKVGLISMVEMHEDSPQIVKLENMLVHWQKDKVGKFTTNITEDITPQKVHLLEEE